MCRQLRDRTAQLSTEGRIRRGPPQSQMYIVLRSCNPRAGSSCAAMSRCRPAHASVLARLHWGRSVTSLQMNAPKHAWVLTLWVLGHMRPHWHRSSIRGFHLRKVLSCRESPDRIGPRSPGTAQMNTHLTDLVQLLSRLARAQSACVVTFPEHIDDGPSIHK